MHISVKALLASFLFCSISLAQPASAPATSPARGRGRGGPPPSATMPAMQNGTGNRQAQFQEIAKQGNIDLLFLGDSITDFWMTPGPRRGGKAVWDQYFAPLKPANFGVNAARTQNVLWQAQNGLLDGFHAKCIVMMLGTNNISVPDNIRNTDEETLAGLKLVINEIRLRQPQAKLLLLAIFPRGQTADSPHRPHIKALNAELAKLADNQHIFFLDIGDKFLQPDGSISDEIMADYLHPTEKGYQIWADAMLPKVKELMSN